MLKALNEFTVEIKEPLQKEVTYGNLTLAIDPDFDKTRHTNRVGKILAIPRGYEGQIKLNYQVLIVHTVLLPQIYKGIKTDPTHLMCKEKGHYRVPNDMVIMYREDEDSEWKCNGIFVLVKPIKAEKKDFVVGSFELPANHFHTDIISNSHGYIPQYGYVSHSNSELDESGVAIGDKVFFKDFGDYEFKLDKDVYYCMDNKDILAIINE